jgi:hypothetical protein
MQESTPENARTWRDLSDQLTPAQITELQREERTRCDPGALLWQARRYTEAALGDLLQGDIEAPADATEVHPWETGYYEYGWSRTFKGTCWKAAGFSVEIFGVQGEGGVRRGASVVTVPRRTGAAVRPGSSLPR